MHHFELIQHAHDTLRQVRMDWQRGLPEIEWEIRTPPSPEYIAKKIFALKIVAFLVPLLMLSMIVYVYYKTQLSVFFHIMGVIIVMQYIHWFSEYHKIRQKTYVSTTIMVDLKYQYIIVSCDGNIKHHKFHQNTALPAFWLPPNDSAEFVRQRDDLQKQIAMKIGVHFE